MFPISKFVTQSYLGLCTASGLVKRMRLRGADFWLKNLLISHRKIYEDSARHSCIVLASPEVVHKLDRTLLYVLILRTHIKFVWKKQMVALGVCFQQPNSSAGRRFAVPRSHLHSFRQIISFSQPLERDRWNKCLVNWTPLRNRICLRNTQLNLKLGIRHKKGKKKLPNL